MPPKQLHILIVEDSPANQEIVRIYLNRLGHTVDTANNGKEAIESLKQKKYDAVFMDCQMPVMDGIEATQYIRSQTSSEIDPETYIIALTADNFPGNKEKLLADGMNDFVAKPFTQKELERALSYVENDLDTPIEYPPEILELFKSEIASNIDTLNAALKTNDLETIRRIAHTIEGTSANFGALRMKEIALEIKKIAQDNPNSAPAIPPLISQLEDNFERFKEKLFK